jgi:uroporphyrinogen-III decarboxylase
MPSLSPKENYLRALRHEEYEYVPSYWFSLPGGDAAGAGFLTPTEHGQASNNFTDFFGVKWVASDSAVGGMMPAPREFILRDVTQWKKTITIGNIDSFDWEKTAEEESTLFKIDRDRQAVAFFCANGVWERLASLMGFEEAMVALVEEPEACTELFTAITDFKIKQAERALKYYKADVFVNFDDIATERNLFMSPETYRRLIKPHHTRLYQEIRNMGMIPVQHTCGHAELCVEDYIETGTAAWNSIQPTNDIAGILDRYGDRFCVEGGFNTNGKPGRPDATVDEVKAEVERCFRDYGEKRGFVFWPSLLSSTDGDSKDFAAKNAAIVETANRLRFTGK